MFLKLIYSLTAHLLVFMHRLLTSTTTSHNITSIPIKKSFLFITSNYNRLRNNHQLNLMCFMMRCFIISSSNHSLPAIFIIFILSCSLACSNFPFSSSFYVMLKIAILWINKYICINVCTLKTNERMVEWDCLRGLINYYVVLFLFLCPLIFFFSF